MLVEFVKQWRLETFLSNNISVTILLVCFTLFFLYKLNKRSPSGNFNLPPSPPKLPFIGNLHQIGEKPHVTFRELSNKYGPIMLLHLGRAKAVIVSSPDIAREILLTRDLEFANKHSATIGEFLVYGSQNVIFMPFGDDWKLIQKIFAQEITTASKMQSYKYIMEEEVELMTKKISSSCSLQTPVDLTELICHTIFSMGLRCGLSNKKVDNSKLPKLIREIIMQMGGFAFGDFFPSLGWMDILSSYRWRRTFKQIDSDLENIIKGRVTERKTNTADENDLLDRLLRAQQENNLTRDQVKATIMSFLFGLEDSVGALEWVIAELFSNPRAMMKCQEEVRRVVGMKSKVHVEDLNQMKYLKSAIKETLRLHAPAPNLIPRFMVDGAKLGGYDLPPNSSIMINVWAFHRDPEIWDNPEEFIPERFVDSSIDFKGNNYHFLPFGSGRRSCSGISFGLAIVEVVLANLLFGFDWKLPEGLEKLDMDEECGGFVLKRNHVELVPILYTP